MARIRRCEGQTERRRRAVDIRRWYHDVLPRVKAWNPWAPSSVEDKVTEPLHRAFAVVADDVMLQEANILVLAIQTTRTSIIREDKKVTRSSRRLPCCAATHESLSTELT